MAFQIYPGVITQEFDLTTIIPAVATTAGALVGVFDWGPLNQIITVSNELELVNRFGKPTQNTFVDFFTAANFLNYSTTLRIVGAKANTSYNAVERGDTVQIANRDDYDDNWTNGANTYGMFAAKYPGDKGNSLKVSFVGSASAYTGWPYAGYFTGAPGTSDYATGQGGANDEIHMVVVDTDGKFSGAANTVLERFPFVSKASDATNADGTNNYYVNVLNDQSQYVYWLSHPYAAMNIGNTDSWGSVAFNKGFGAPANSYTVSLANGTFVAPTTSDKILALDQFKAPDIDISLLMTGNPDSAFQVAAIALAEERRDIVTFVSPPMANVVNNRGSEASAIISYRNTNFPSSSYAFMDSNWKYMNDKYNNVFRWVPLNGDIAGLAARTDFDRDPWWSPAGFNRGHILNTYRLAWSPSKANLGDIYSAGINPVLNFTGEGPVLYGDKTLQAKPSAFDRINVRRLFIVLEKAIAKAAQYSLFEFNDEFTRAQFVAMVEPFLRDVQGRRGITKYKVVCDTTNNTDAVINRNEFVGDIYVVPNKSINFITLRFWAVGSTVNFEEIVGKNTI